MAGFETGVDERTGEKWLAVRGPWHTDFINFFRNKGYTSLRLNQSLGFTGRRLDFLADIPNLLDLNVLRVGMEDDSGIEACEELRTLSLHSDARNTLRLSILPGLRDVFVNRLEGREDLLTSTTVRRLYIYGYRGHDLMALTGMTALRSLEIGPARNLSSLVGPRSLETLQVALATRLADLAGLASMPNLQALQLTSCRHIETLDPLANLRRLTFLSMVDCANIPTLDPLRGLALTKLFLVGNTKVLDGKLRHLVESPALQDTAFHAWRHYDITQAEAATIVRRHLVP